MKKPTRSNLIRPLILALVILLTTAIAVQFHAEVDAKKPAAPPGLDKKDNDNNYTESVYLQDIDSGLTSPTGKFRWLDAANNEYSTDYRNSYNYTQAVVKVSCAPSGQIFEGMIEAQNLKPNFTYQIKLGGYPETYPTANEGIGLAGRWWQEIWDETEWTDGTNLNNKGDGTSPNPNDQVYFDNKNDPDYRYYGYIVFGYFITDSKGNASLTFRLDSSYHVLWKTSQRQATLDDGPVKQANIKVNPRKSAAYDIRYPVIPVSIFGEWERLPVGGVFLAPGAYTCQFFLTEESFHSDGGTFAGNWAAAMGAPLSFEITE